MKAIDNMKNKYAAYQELDSRDKKTFWKESLIDTCGQTNDTPCRKVGSR